jgi:hypothetical protein
MLLVRMIRCRRNALRLLRPTALRDLWRFVVLYKEFKWGRQIANAALQRPLLNGYSVRKWL